MRTFDLKLRTFAMALAALAGFVDALGFLKLGGLFVSFMSGNSTRLAVDLAHGSRGAVMAAGLIASFITGAFLGSMAGSAAPLRRRERVLALLCLLLVAASVLHLAGSDAGAVIVTALAMGAENAVFEEQGQVRFGVTYMTGTLVKVGQGLAAAARGGDPFGWAPHLMLWAGLVAGAALGALTYPVLGLGALWLAALSAAVLSALAVGLRALDAG